MNQKCIIDPAETIQVIIFHRFKIRHRTEIVKQTGFFLILLNHKRSVKITSIILIDHPVTSVWGWIAIACKWFIPPGLQIYGKINTRIITKEKSFLSGLYPIRLETCIKESLIPFDKIRPHTYSSSSGIPSYLFHRISTSF